MLAEFLNGFYEAVRDTFQERAVSERADDYALTACFGDKIGVDEKL